MQKRKKNAVRLTNNVIPQKYEMRIKPDLEKFVFDGEETIYLSIKKPTKTISLHAKELSIQSADATSTSGTVIAQKISFNDKLDTVTFTFKSNVPRGAVRLHIVFAGILNNNMHGFYRSSYESAGKTRYMATTQFESTDARRAFPCFDEPALKAVFEVTLVVPKESTAISNTMPNAIRAYDKDHKIVTFAPTPLMSTYLLAFIVGDFEFIQKKSKDGVLVRVFVTPGKKHQAKFALDCAEKTVTFFNKYFDIPYPLPVLDLIAIPDFSAGAMENWGAITYRESALLVDPENSSTMNKQWVALVIAHEIAHQWFGNLVTMEWWTHLWLNEGFASYIEYLAVDHVFPEWDIWTHFLYSDHGRALHADGLKNTHPIEVEVHHPEEIAAVFDSVSYSKGASIIRMLADYLGEKDFRDGLRFYLKKHSYSNTFTIDLWNALQKISGKPVGKIMANWTGKGGYPLVFVKENGAYFNLQQSRFFASPISEKETRDPTRWHVPVSFKSGSAKGHVLISARTAHIPKTTDTWFKLNINESGFYRTLYSQGLRDQLGHAVSSNQLQTRDRLGLIRDVMAIVETGRLSSTESLSFAQHYKGEQEYIVWSEMALGLGKIRSLIVREPFLRHYESFALDIFADITKKITWNTKPKDHSQALLKVLVLGNLGRYGDEKTIVRAQKLFDSIKGAPGLIPADLRGIVYEIVARYGGNAEYAKLLKMYKTTSLQEEKNRIGWALGFFRQESLLQKTLDLALSNHVRRQDSVRMISAVSVNPHGSDLAWTFIKSNWKVFLERYEGSREISYLLEPLGSSASLNRAKDIESFLRKNPAPGTERTVQQVLEHIRSNAAWLARDKEKLAAFL